MQSPKCSNSKQLPDLEASSPCRMGGCSSSSSARCCPCAATPSCCAGNRNRSVTDQNRSVLLQGGPEDPALGTVRFCWLERGRGSREAPPPRKCPVLSHWKTEDSNLHSKSLCAHRVSALPAKPLSCQQPVPQKSPYISVWFCCWKYSRQLPYSRTS